MKTASDIELWEAIRDGDTSAWNRLVRRYESLVYTVALRAGLSAADAADCFQQVWLALYKHQRSIKEPGRLSAWLVTTAKREAIRLSRKARASTTSEIDISLVDSGKLPDEQLEQLEKQAHLEQAVAQLDPRCRELIKLLFYAPEEMSYSAIAKRLNIAFNSLGPIRRRCLDRLRVALSDLDY